MKTAKQKIEKEISRLQVSKDKCKKEEDIWDFHTYDGEQKIWKGALKYIEESISSEADKPKGEEKLCECACTTGREVDEDFNQICTTCGRHTSKHEKKVKGEAVTPQAQEAKELPTKDEAISEVQKHSTSKLSERERVFIRLITSWINKKASAIITKERAEIEELKGVIEDKHRLTRELDEIINGKEGMAKQASLCDIVSQLRTELQLLRKENERLKSGLNKEEIIKWIEQNTFFKSQLPLDWTKLEKYFLSLPTPQAEVSKEGRLCFECNSPLTKEALFCEYCRNQS